LDWLKGYSLFLIGWALALGQLGLGIIATQLLGRRIGLNAQLIF